MFFPIEFVFFLHYYYFNEKIVKDFFNRNNVLINIQQVYLIVLKIIRSNILQLLLLKVINF